MIATAFFLGLIVGTTMGVFVISLCVSAAMADAAHINIQPDTPMACLEHWCRYCEYVWFDNAAHASCPRCCSSDVHTWWDEDNGDHGSDDHWVATADDDDE